MGRLLAFLKHALLDGNKTSFGRVAAIPFLLSSWGTLTAGAIMGVIHGKDYIESCISLATIGIALYSGSKYLTVKGQAIGVASTSEPETASDEQPEEAA